jgi:hypothetical protein
MKRLLGIVLIIIGILTYLFFRNYTGNFLPYSTLWFFVGIILVIIGFRLFITSKSKHVQQLEKSFQEEIDRLKHYGEKINVDFKDCEIISSNYYKEVPKSSNYRVQALDSIYDSSRSVENVEINQSRITYQDKNLSYDYIFISPLINKDNITLSFTLDKYKKTTIYVDKKDKSLYYFDLEFLNK